MLSKIVQLSLWMLFLIQASEGRRCNEVICASVVSKCILTQACKCDFNAPDCTCCVTCMKCLGEYFDRCCSCLDMCDTSTSGLDSQVGDFEDSFVEYFIAITEIDEPIVDGIAISYPADLAIEDLTKRLKKHSFNKNLPNHSPLMPMTRLGINCTVVFMSKCHSSSSCKEICYKIGAVQYRYFFNGCCECIGPSCLNYGINEARCPKCSSTFDDLDYYDFENMSDQPEQSNAIGGGEDYVQ